MMKGINEGRFRDDGVYCTGDEQNSSSARLVAIRIEMSEIGCDA